MPDLPEPGSAVPRVHVDVHDQGSGSRSSGELAASAPQLDPVLCQHCGRTASNGISCQGSCVADSGY